MKKSVEAVGENPNAVPPRLHIGSVAHTNSPDLPPANGLVTEADVRGYLQRLDLSAKEARLVESILARLENDPRRDALLKQLLALLQTESLVRADGANPSLGQENLRDLDDSVRQAEAVAAGHTVDAHFEEAMAVNKSRKWTLAKGDGLKFYRVDNSDPKNVVARIKVALAGPPALVEKVMRLEDAIEKRLQLPGFTVDLQLSAATGWDRFRPDVFVVKIEPEHWAASDNWAGGRDALAHELMHLFGLDDDYDAIESHAANANMSRLERLESFADHMDDKPPPADADQSIMNDERTGVVLERHACEVAKLPIEPCVKARAGVSTQNPISANVSHPQRPSEK